MKIIYKLSLWQRFRNHSLIAWEIGAVITLAFIYLLQASGGLTQFAEDIGRAPLSISPNLMATFGAVVVAQLAIGSIYFIPIVVNRICVNCIGVTVRLIAKTVKKEVALDKPL